MIQLNLSRTPMYSSQAANSTGSNHQSQENYHDGTWLAHRSNLIDTGTTAQPIQGYKYGRLRLNFQSASDSPPPPPPSPSSIQAWQRPVPAPLAVVLGRNILPKYLPSFNECWLCQQSPPWGRKSSFVRVTAFQASTIYNLPSVKQEGADWLCGVTGAHAPHLVLLRTKKHISNRNI